MVMTVSADRIASRLARRQERPTSRPLEDAHLLRDVRVDVINKHRVANAEKRPQKRKEQRQHGRVRDHQHWHAAIARDVPEGLRREAPRAADAREHPSPSQRRTDHETCIRRRDRSADRPVTIVQSQPDRPSSATSSRACIRLAWFTTSKRFDSPFSGADIGSHACIARDRAVPRYSQDPVGFVVEAPANPNARCATLLVRQQRAEWLPVGTGSTSADAIPAPMVSRRAALTGFRQIMRDPVLVCKPEGRRQVPAVFTTGSTGGDATLRQIPCGSVRQGGDPWRRR